MRTSFRLLVIGFALIAALAACTKPQPGVPGTGEEPKVEATKPQEQTAIVLRNLLSVWKMENAIITSKTDWIAYLTLGDKVVLANDSQDVTFDGGKDPIKVMKIKLEGDKTGWVFADYLGANGTLSVVIDETSVLYTKPEAIKVTSQSIPRALVVMTVPVEGSDEFAQIHGYDPVGRIAFTDAYKRYIKKTTVSPDSSDVQAAIFLAVAKAETNAGKKENLLIEAVRQFSGSAFSRELTAALAEANPDKAPLPQVESVGIALTCKDAAAKIHSKPFVTAKTAGEVPAGESVIALEATIDSFKVGAVTAKWYRIDAPAAGWIFGGDFTE
ncbi:MAG: hypothetical protein NT080_10875 [Spirochaetes bacterium]|nr:hypothetical protein [Spirochaetota bacterium]